MQALKMKSKAEQIILARHGAFFDPEQICTFRCKINTNCCVEIEKRSQRKHILEHHKQYPQMDDYLFFPFLLLLLKFLGNTG